MLPTQIRTKRIYEKATQADGTRVLVDRLWPRGVSKDRAALQAWLKDLAPSDKLRKLFHEHPESWPKFRKEYCKELRQPEATAALSELYRLASQRKRLTLLFASKDEQHNNAIVLRELLEGVRKPPSGTGPLRAVPQRQAKRLPA
ncbi:MAG: DUF488 domain-containing protein [Terriglobales bacterium]